MRLRELLDPRRIVVPLRATTVREATTQLAHALVQSGVVADRARLDAVLSDDWPEDIVSVAGRAFLPHFRTDAVSAVTVALGVTPRPIRRAAAPAEGARVVILVVAPTSEASAYLRAMAAVAQALGSDEVLEALHAARSAEEVLAIAAFADASVPAEVTVRDVMSPAVVAVPADTPLGEAAQLMLQHRVRSLPVVGPQREVLGMLTEGHVLSHLLPLTVSELSTGPIRAARRRKGARTTPTDPGAVPVREAMDRSVLCLAEDQTVADVAALMLAKDVDRFPVTRDGALVGFLTRGDIIRKLLTR
jgi:CBS domain-containing protein